MAAGACVEWRGGPDSVRLVAMASPEAAGRNGSVFFLYPPLCQHLMGGMRSVGHRRRVSSLESRRGALLRQSDFTRPQTERLTAAVDDGRERDLNEAEKSPLEVDLLVLNYMLSTAVLRRGEERWWIQGGDNQCNSELL
ncbi:hypothetical protein EYF80_018041 [Liparis tanakae]|uniref:Uncharacterized protein n=1 Tax=Liparis tanakae TaxID=230148 RepID=A0A4Z2I1K0_9TELE|nr:hypothetical protein EYF80_018041 [Liparis tanakae]